MARPAKASSSSTTPTKASSSAKAAGPSSPTREGQKKPKKNNPWPVTPDSHYFLWNNWQLWRCTNPNLAPADEARLTGELMAARRAVAQANKLSSQSAKAQALAEARARVQSAKEGLGERGPVWWDAGQEGNEAVDRKHVKNTQYAAWAEGLGLGLGLGAAKTGKKRAGGESGDEEGSGVGRRRKGEKEGQPSMTRETRSKTGES
ncbi:hypothetical protein V8E36_000962 [Tilletia maclaganii]